MYGGVAGGLVIVAALVILLPVVLILCRRRSQTDTKTEKDSVYYSNMGAVQLTHMKVQPEINSVECPSYEVGHSSV